MDLQKMFSHHFGTCVVSQHVVLRMNQRLLAQEFPLIDLMLTNAMRGRKSLPPSFAITDTRYGFGLIGTVENNTVRLITFVRGPDNFKGCEIIPASINQEKMQAEIQAIRNYQKNGYQKKHVA